MKNEERRGRLSDVSTRVGQAVHFIAGLLRADFPDLQIAVVVRTADGLAVVGGEKVEGMEATLQEVERCHRLLRDGAESAGRAVYRSPDGPRVLEREQAEIRVHSAAQIAGWEKSRCQHPKCYVSDAAVAVATAARILTFAGAPDDAIRDLTAVAKEACRRTHLKILEQSAGGSA